MKLSTLKKKLNQVAKSATALSLSRGKRLSSITKHLREVVRKVVKNDGEVVTIATEMEDELTKMGIRWKKKDEAVFQKGRSWELWVWYEVDIGVKGTTEIVLKIDGKERKVCQADVRWGWQKIN